MPNRIIRDSCKTSETLDQLSDGAERMFWRLTTVADDFGRFQADPVILKAACFPRAVDRLKTKQVKSWIDEMTACNLMQTYVSNGQLYGFLVTWEKYQTMRAKTSKWPSPTSENICSQKHTNAPVFVNENEVVIEDEDENENEKPSSPPAQAPGFEKFWAAYPKHVSKVAAEKVWNKLNPTPELLETILAGVERQKKTDGWTKDAGQFIPHPTTWLNQKRWEDEVHNAKPLTAGQRTARNIEESFGFGKVVDHIL